MRSTPAIQKFLAYFLLIIFSVSTSPKIFFHDALAHHTDGQVCKDENKSVPHFHRPAFHCSFDDLVSTSPYLSFDEAPILQQPVFVTQRNFGFASQAVSAVSLHKESRGPPSI